MMWAHVTSPGAEHGVAGVPERDGQRREHGLLLHGGGLQHAGTLAVHVVYAGRADCGEVRVFVTAFCEVLLITNWYVTLNDVHFLL